MVSRYEKGVCLPTREQLAALEEIYGVRRTELYDVGDLDLLDFGKAPSPTPESEGRTVAPPPSHQGRFRKCYRISREFAESLPDDLLQVCGYSSWQSWHDAALKRLLGEYAARSKAAKKGAGPPSKAQRKRVLTGEDEQRIGADARRQPGGAERSL